MRKIFITLPFALIFVFACTKKEQAVKYEDRILFQMGTVVNVTLPTDKTGLIPALEQYMEDLADIVTTDSVAISTSDEAVEISRFTYELIKRGEEYTRLSKGHFTPSAYTLISLYGFPEGPFAIPTDADAEHAMELIASRDVTVFQTDEGYFADGNGLSVDFGAYAKGWIVDKCAEFLKKQGVENFIINAGGDLFASGSKAGGIKWRLGITDPDKQLAHINVVDLEEKALATSGIYERYFTSDTGERITHIFDVVTGKNPRIYKSLSVIADNVELADALSTVYFMMAPEEVKETCGEYSTPVFYVTIDGGFGRLCGWEEYEAN